MKALRKPGRPLQTSLSMNSMIVQLGGKIWIQTSRQQTDANMLMRTLVHHKSTRAERDLAIKPHCQCICGCGLSDFPANRTAALHV